jgi:hypothetical protein
MTIIRILAHLLLVTACGVLLAGCTVTKPQFAPADQLTLSLPLGNRPSAAQPGPRTVRLDGLFFETTTGRTMLPDTLAVTSQGKSGRSLEARAKTSDGRLVTIIVAPEGKDCVIRLDAQTKAWLEKR